MLGFEFPDAASEDSSHCNTASESAASETVADVASEDAESDEAVSDDVANGAAARHAFHDGASTKRAIIAVASSALLSLRRQRRSQMSRSRVCEVMV